MNAPKCWKRMFLALCKLGESIRRILSEVFSDNKGHLSSLRIIVFVFMFNFIVMWDVMMFKTEQWIPLNLGDVAALVGLLAAQSFQKKSELRFDPSKVPDSPPPVEGFQEQGGEQ